MRYYIRDRIRAILNLNEPPHKLALAFSLGIFVAFTPTIGLHILTGLLFAKVFRVSSVVVITASFINNPWTIVPLYGFCTWFGIKITGGGNAPSIEWNEISITNFYVILKPYIWPFLVGTLTAGIIAAVISYFSIYFIIKYRSRIEGPDL